MRSMTKLLLATLMMASATAQATIVVSGCVTVTAVVNEEYGNAIILAVSPAISGCTPNTTPGVEFAVGVNGVTATNLNSYLASGLTAFTSGTRVMVEYDNSTSNCYGMAVASGGFHGEC